MAIIKIRNPAIDLDAAEIPNLDASKITTGSFDASRIGSGTFADARIAASNVSQHATSFDDNKLVNDISTLALRQASNENKSAYNTNSMYIDVFQDATGLTGLTNAARTDDEFVASVYEIFASTATKLDWFSPKQNGTTVGASNYQVKSAGGGSYDNTSYTDVVESGTIQYVSHAKSQTTTEGNGWSHSGGHTGTIEFYADYKETKRFSTRLDISKNNNWGDFNQMRLQYSTDGSNWSNVDMSGISQSGSTVYGTSSITSGGGLTSSSGTSAGLFSFNANSTSGTAISGFTMIGLPDFDARYIRFQKQSLHSAANNNVGGLYWDFYNKEKSVGASATGSFENNAITASSSISSMGAIITYQDNAGTNALNTDIVLKLSADGGSNYSTATLVAMPDFATGIKMAKVNDLSVTAGTSLKYKLEFANQASGSKEARIRGVSLQY